MKPDYISDQKLMDQIFARICEEGPQTIFILCRVLERDPWDVRQALNDLIHYGKVAQCLDGRQYERAHGGYTPEPDGDKAV